jgi:PPOX class probable F420-dependent enzyme
MNLSSAEREFLDMPGYLRLATLMPDGAPQITVLWYRLADDVLNVICPQSAQKVSNLDRDGRVSGVIEDPESAHRYMELRGNCEVIRDDKLARQEMVHIARRYIGDRAEAFAAGLSVAPRVILQLTPVQVRRYGIS